MATRRVYRKRSRSRKSKRRKSKSKRKKRKRRRSKRGSQGGLTRWFNEKWVDVCTGKPCGRKKYSRKGMPYCRPSRRVNKGTPKTRRKLSKKKKREMRRKKRRRPTKKMKRV
mgnify:CR=1 FL=1